MSASKAEITVLFIRSLKRWQPTDFIHQVCRGHDMRYLRHADVDLRGANSPRGIGCYAGYSILPRMQRLLPQLEAGEFHALVFEGVGAVGCCQDLCEAPPPRLSERYDFLGASPSEFDALEDIYIFFNSVVTQPNCPSWLVKLFCKYRPEDLPPCLRTPEIKFGMREQELLSTLPSLRYRPKRASFPTPLSRRNSIVKGCQEKMSNLRFWRRSSKVYIGADDEPPGAFLRQFESDEDDEDDDF
ncbi:hypothetical protein HDZ31DRAFT_34425 [Schizophyllum fasciatum]